MSFFKRLASLFTGRPSTDRRNLTIYVLSTRCNEPLAAQVDTLNALSGSDDGDASYYTRKVIQGTGKNRCFAQVEVELWFNSQRVLLRHAVSGGRWLTEEEYESELERFNAPPPEEEDDEEDDEEDKEEADEEAATTEEDQTGGSGGFG